MKSERDSLDMNVIEYEGDIVPWTDVNPEIGAEWIASSGEDVLVSDIGSQALNATNLTELLLLSDSESKATGMERTYPEWQRDRDIYAHLGLDTFTNEEFRTLPAHEYDSWQRVIRNYVKSLRNHAGRIRLIDGQIELDYGLAKDYGMDRNPKELLQYAAILERMVEAIEKRGLIDHSRDDVFTARKLKNAPPYRAVHVVQNNDKLHLHIAPVQKQTA